MLCTCRGTLETTVPSGATNYRHILTEIFEDEPVDNHPSYLDAEPEIWCDRNAMSDFLGNACSTTSWPSFGDRAEFRKSRTGAMRAADTWNSRR